MFSPYAVQFHPVVFSFDFPSNVGFNWPSLDMLPAYHRRMELFNVVI